MTDLPAFEEQIDGDLKEGVLIGIDWGTTNVRAVVLASDGRVLAYRRADSKIAGQKQQNFESRFDHLTKDWPKLPVVAAGMIGSRQGWKEVPYIACPATTEDLSRSLLTFDYNDRPVAIVPGVKLERPGQYDVMRGEETQLAGFLLEQPNETGTVVLPGTHSKWARIKDGTILDFRTYMTGELFDIISNRSILSHSLRKQNVPDEAFRERAERLARSGESISGQLFRLRAADLLSDADKGELWEELSALLIVGELKSAAKDGFEEQSNTILIGASQLTDFYDAAFRAFGRKTTRIKGTSLVWPALMEIARQTGMIAR